MNREILFRGKRLDNNEWLYGSHFTDSGEDYIIPQNLLGINDYEEYQVDQNTVGQFTGLRDKNGRKIYEGDVVRRKDSAYGMEDIGVVKFDCSLGAFVLESENRGRTYRAVFKKGFSDNDGKCTIEGTYSYELLGNVYDNPELLKKFDKDPFNE